MKTQHLFLFGLLSASALAISNSAQAEYGCQAGHIPVYQGPQQVCVADYNLPHWNQTQSKKTTGYWQKTWGAIAPSPTDAILGVAESVGSKKEAEQIALKDCKAKGGKDCKVNLAYHNQCAVMIVGDESLESYGNATIAEATQRGLADCNQREKGCRVYYSACAKPIYHRR